MNHHEEHKDSRLSYLKLSGITAKLSYTWKNCVEAAACQLIFTKISSRMPLLRYSVCSNIFHYFVSFLLFAVKKKKPTPKAQIVTLNIQRPSQSIRNSMFNVRRSMFASVRRLTFIWIWLLLFYFGSFARPAFGQTTCAKIKLVIKQEVALERQAFEAELTIANGFLVPLENFQVTVWAREAGRSQYLTLKTIDGLEFFSNSDSEEIFFFSPQDKTDPVDIAAGSEKNFTYLLIPTQEAALNTEGTAYELGADISYTSGGEDISLSVEPDVILVKPQPGISLEYFLPKSVIADDPNTPAVETSEPFDLGLRVINSGYGAAENLKVESFQPSIEENEQGLLIEFRILGSRVNGADSAPSFTVNFGRLLAGHAETASWQMLSTLYGRFLEAKASFTHSDELGGSITSLIEEAKVYRLVGTVQANADGIPDFLSVGSGSTGAQANGKAAAEPEDFALDLRTAAFLNLHPSGLQGDGSVSTIDKLNVANFSSYLGTISLTDDQLDVPIMDPPQSGETSYSFVRILDPRKNHYNVRSVVRTDGVVLNPANYNLSTEIKEDADGGIDGFEHFIDIFDIGNAGGDLSYTVFYGEAIEENQAPIIVPLPDLTLRAGDAVELTVEAFDPNGDPVLLSVVDGNLPTGATFTDNDDNTATFAWPVAAQGFVPLTIFASDGALSATDSITINVLAVDYGLNEWLDLYGLNLDAATLESDSDGDGYTTLLEYALNLNPLVTSLKGLPRVRVETVDNESFLVLECDVLNTVVDPQSAMSALIDLEVIVTADSTLEPSLWTVLTSRPVKEPSPIPGMTRLYWRDDTPLSNFPQGRFMRLQATYNNKSDNR